MAFSKKITIFDENKGYGANPQTERINEKTVWCKFERSGMNSTFKAMAAGVEVSYQVMMWAGEYSNQQYAVIGGEKYKIISANKTGNERIIRLMLSRG